MVRRFSPAFSLFAALLFSFPLIAQIPPGPPRPPLPGGLGATVLLAENSIQLGRDVVVTSGDVIVNNPATGPVLGEKELSLDRGASTPAGFRIAAHGIDLDHQASAAGDAEYNFLTNEGTIAGTQTSPLSLPIFQTLPPPMQRTAGSTDVNVEENGLVTLGEGDYGALNVGINGRVDFSGGAYTFSSITVSKNGHLRFQAPSSVAVIGRLHTSKDAQIVPHSSSTINAAAIHIQVQGVNGLGGGLFEIPPAALIGHRNIIKANIYVTSGALVFEHEVDATGSFIAKDIMAGRLSRFTINHRLNAPPVGEPQTVFTDGINPKQITLVGVDPEGTQLTFSIATQPTQGVLSSINILSQSTASVTYTPSTASNAADSLSFKVRDTAGASGFGTVKINPGVGDEGPTPGSTFVPDQFLTTNQDTAAKLRLTGGAPPGVSLTFSILPLTGPNHGTLGPLTQGTEVPRRSATVMYTPNAGFRGDDSFQFEACGVINGSPSCDTATFQIRVVESRLEPPPPAPVVAEDQEVSTKSDAQVSITLGGTSLQSRFGVESNAVALIPAVMSGAVADANLDGIGDNHNPLPGPSPIIASAGVGLTGGPGSNGTARMNFEWNISNFTPASVNGLTGASLVFPTRRGTVDSLDTFFYWIGGNNDGALNNADYARPAERIPGAVMPVPSTQPVGADGSFSFPILPILKGAVEAGQNYLTIQARVDETLAFGRGLGVRTTAGGNVFNGQVPMLMLATPGVVAPLQYRIMTLPLSGSLYDGNDSPITNVPYLLPSPVVKYTPAIGFIGTQTFTFEVSNGQASDSGTITVRVTAPDCSANEEDCDNGRD